LTVAIVVKSKRAEDDREPIPPGNYLGVIISLFDIGTQDGQFGPKHQIITQTELFKKRPGSTIVPAVDSKGRPFMVSTFYPLSFGSMNGKKSKLRSDVEVITGHVFTDQEAETVGFDLQNLLGLSYQLSLAEHIKADGKKIARIVAVMSIDAGDPRPESQFNETYFELDAETIKSGKLDGVPPWIARFVQRSKEWISVHGAPRDDGASTNGSRPSIPPPGSVDGSEAPAY
jgi:hypothetical protein